MPKSDDEAPQAPQVVPDSPISQTSAIELFGQVLAAVHSLQQDVAELRDRLDNVATREDLNLLLPKETFENFRDTIDQRFSEQAHRLTQAEERDDVLTDRIHAAELRQLTEQRHQRQTLDARAWALLIALCTLVGEPAISALISWLMHR